jgi:hypothetical protein
MKKVTMSTFQLRPMPLLMLALTLACCTRTDPDVRAGEWHPLGANAANLRAMVANQSDLYAGHGAVLSPGDEATAAVVRLRLDQTKPLEASSLSDIKTSDTGSSTQGGSGASAASPVQSGATAAPAAAQ